LILNSSNSPIYPLLVQLGRRNATRYDHTWPITFLYHGVAGGHPFDYRTPDRLTAAELRFFAELGEDLRRWRPRLVLARRGQCPACPEGFEVSAYLQHAGFADRYLHGCRRIEDETAAAVPFDVWGCDAGAGFSE